MKPWIPAVTALLALAPLAAAAAHEPAADLDELLAVRVSSASRFDQVARRAPASVTIITSEEIDRFGYRTLAEALASVPGLYFSYDRNYSYVGVRGFSRPTDYNNRVLILLDGYRLNEDVYGYAPVGTDLPIDLRAVERIEVVRGPGSVAFGTAAMLAVVNVVLKHPEAVAGSEVAVEAGSYERYGLSAHGGGERPGGFGATWSLQGSDAAGANLYYPEYDAPETGGGRTRGTDGDRNFGATAVAGFGPFELTALAIERQKGFPTGAWGVRFGDPEARTTDGWQLLGLRWERPLDERLTLSARGQVGHYAYDGVYPSARFGDRNWMESTDNAWWGADLQARWEQSSRHRLTAGLEYRDNTRADYRTFDNLGGSAFQADHPFQVTSLFAEDELQLGEDLLLTLGLRHDDYPEAGSSTNPRLALIYFPDRATSLKLLYGRAFRAPNLYETRYDDVRSAAKGNLDLRPEVVETAELVAERRLGESLFAEVSVFRSQFHDLIDQRLDPADGLYQYRNTVRATSTGAELDLRLRCCRGLLAYGSASYQRTEDDATGERLSNSPRLLLKAGLSGHLTHDWRAAVELTRESGRSTVQGTTTDSFVLADASVSWEPEGPFSVELQVRNLLDTDYAYPGGFEHRQDAIVQDGRSFTLRLGARF